MEWLNLSGYLQHVYSLECLSVRWGGRKQLSFPATSVLLCLFLHHKIAQVYINICLFVINALVDLSHKARSLYLGGSLHSKAIYASQVQEREGAILCSPVASYKLVSKVCVPFR